VTTTASDPTTCERIARRLAASVGHESFQRYFAGSARLDLRDGRLAVAVPTTFYARWLEGRFGESLLHAAKAETGMSGLVVSWQVEPGSPLPDPAHASVAGEARAPARPAARGRPRRPSAVSRGAASPRYTLDGFVVGPANQMAFAAVQRLAQSQAQPPSRVLFLHGTCGVGKTHLLHALAHAFLSSQPGASVRVTTGEGFTNDFVGAVRTGSVERFRAALRKVDLLCIDDVHFLSGKSATQSEFLHTFDALDLSGARVALASDAHPRLIAHFSERLASRCVSGMVVKIDAPDPDTRRRIISRMAEVRCLPLNAEGIEAVSRRCEGSVRDVEGALTRLEAARRLLGSSTPGDAIDAAFVRRALGEAADRGPRRPLRLAAIVDAACAELGVQVTDVLGRGRHKRIVLARSMIGYVARQATTHSFPEIAQALGRPNHSTVVTACQRMRRAIESGATVDLDDGTGPVPVVELFERVRRAAGAAPQRPAPLTNGATAPVRR